MTTRDTVYVALFAALVAALGVIPPIYLPIVPVPITAQTLGVMLAGSVLGARLGGLALSVFVVLVLVGLPLLSGGRGGISALLGPTGGFLISWPFAAYLIGALTERNWSRYNFLWALLFNVIGGIGVVYLFGILWLAVAANLPLLQAAVSSAVFIPGDSVKVVIASLIAVTLKRSYPIIGKTDRAA